MIRKTLIPNRFLLFAAPRFWGSDLWELIDLQLIVHHAIIGTGHRTK